MPPYPIVNSNPFFAPIPYYFCPCCSCSLPLPLPLPLSPPLSLFPNSYPLP